MILALAHLWWAWVGRRTGSGWLYGENLTVHFAEEPQAQYAVQLPLWLEASATTR